MMYRLSVAVGVAAALQGVMAQNNPFDSKAFADPVFDSAPEAREAWRKAGETFAGRGGDGGLPGQPGRPGQPGLPGQDNVNVRVSNARTGGKDFDVDASNGQKGASGADAGNKGASGADAGNKGTSGADAEAVADRSGGPGPGPEAKAVADQNGAPADRQEMITGPLDNYPAKKNTTLPWLDGGDKWCAPWGPQILWNETYFPCRYAIEREMASPGAVDEGASNEEKQKAWKKQQKDLCDDPVFFDASGPGCVGCKKAYKLESPENHDEWLKFFDELKNEYCKAETLSGNYAHYHAELRKKYNFNYPADGPQPLPPKSIPVEDYWTIGGKKQAVEQPPAASIAFRGTVTLSDVVRFEAGFVNTSPSTNSSKFAQTKQLLVIRVTILSRTLSVDDNGPRVSAKAEKDPFVYTVSGGNANDVSPNGWFLKASIDLSGCTCAKSVIPQGNKAVVKEGGAQVDIQGTVEAGQPQSLSRPTRSAPHGGAQPKGASGSVDPQAAVGEADFCEEE